MKIAFSKSILFMVKFLPKFLAVFLFAFGALTLFLSGSIIFDLFDVRAQQGNYVLFVIWANFLSSLMYLTASYGMFTAKKWTFYSLSAVLTLLVITFIGFYVYVNSGGIHETKTMGALIFRTMITLVFTISAYTLINNNKPQNN